MLRWALRNLDKPIAVFLLGPSERKSYYRGDLWDCGFTGAMVPMRNVFTVPEWDAFVPRSVLPESHFRWNGHTLVVVRETDRSRLLSALDGYPVDCVFTAESELKQLRPLLRAVFVRWPLELARNLAQLAAELQVLDSWAPVVAPRGGLWVWGQLQTLFRANGCLSAYRCSIAAVSERFTEPCTALSSSVEGYVKNLVLIDESIGTGNTALTVQQLSGGRVTHYAALGRTYSDEAYESILGCSRSSLCLPDIRTTTMPFRLVENCPELLGFDIEEGQLVRRSTRLGARLSLDVLEFAQALG